MKKNKIYFETNFWAAYEIGNPFEVLDAFFDYAHLPYYKQRLTEAVLYPYLRERLARERNEMFDKKD